VLHRQGPLRRSCCPIWAQKGDLGRRRVAQQQLREPSSAHVESRRTRLAFGPASGSAVERLHSGRERAAVGLSREAISSTDLGAFSDSRRRNFSRLTEMTRSVLRKLLRPSFHMAAGTAA
jgi:hypothetical protein